MTTRYRISSTKVQVLKNKLATRAVVHGDWVFVSGTTGFDYSKMTIADDIESQTKQCLRISKRINPAGASLRMSSASPMSSPDADQFPRCWPILKEYFGEIRPLP